MLIPQFTNFMYCSGIQRESSHDSNKMSSAPLVELLHAFAGCQCYRFSSLMRQKWSVSFMHVHTRQALTLRAPLDERGCFKQKHAGNSWHFTSATSFGISVRCYKCFLATTPCKWFPPCSLSENSLLPGATGCSIAPLVSYLKYILILQTLPRVCSGTLSGLHQKTLGSVSTVFINADFFV